MNPIFSKAIPGVNPPCFIDRKAAFHLAKRMLPEYVFDASKLENNPLTFPEVQTLMDGITVGGHKVSDVQQVLNIRDAWDYVLSSIANKTFRVDKPTFCHVQSLIARGEAMEPGYFRTGNVGIAGTEKYQCPPPEDLDQIFSEGLLHWSTLNPIISAIQLFLWASLNQFFWDGNKRTARIMASGLLIQAGIGVFNIKARDVLEFNTKMVRFYDTQEADEIAQFLAEKCIVIASPERK